MNVALEKSKNLRDNVVGDLKILLSNSYILYVKTQNYHWNVVGPRFEQLHLFFEKLYQELSEAIDIIAEQIRILESRPPSAMKEFLQLTTLEESEERNLDENKMLESLLSDNQYIQEELKKWIERAQQFGDEGTADLMINRLRAHEKNCWMIRSHLKKV